MLELAGRPDHLSLAEIAARLAGTHGLRVHLTTVHRALRRAGWTCKKLSLRAAERAREDVAQARATWWTDAADGLGGISPERLVFLDECGVLTAMARLHGRSPRGTRAHGSVPCGRWERLTVLGALGSKGVVAAMGVEAATSAEVFHAFLDQALLPELRRTRPDAVLVMDNLAAHKAPRVRALLDGSGFAYRYLPAYSPDLNPIEPTWAKVKAELRRVAARSVGALHEALGPALAGVTPQDAAGCFRHCGYAHPR